ncbi:MAG: MFS transporter [Pseudomonadota bacterium]
MNRTLSAFYLTGSLRELIPIYPLYAIMFTERGISPIELSLLFSAWALIGIITEIPSGALADRLGRKWLIVASGFFKAAAFLSWFFWQDFYGYLIGFLLWGFGSTLKSGAWEALLFETLGTRHQSNQFTAHNGRIKALAQIGVVIGELAGGFLIIWGWDTVLLISAAVPVLATLPFIFLVRDIPRPSRDQNYLAILKAGVIETMTNRTISFLFLSVAFLLVIFGVYDEYAAPVLSEGGFSHAWVAWLFAAIYVAKAIGHVVAGWYTRVQIPTLVTLMGVSGLSLALLPLVSGWWLPTLLAIFFFVFGFASTLLDGKLQDQITGHARATVTSTVGLGDGFGAILWFMIFGVMAESFGMIGASVGLSALMCISCVTLYALATRWRISDIQHPQTRE